jgi:TonB family protein
MMQRKKRNSSRVNLIVSVVFHTVAIGALFFFAAREGMLGKKLKQLTVTMVPKEKKPEPPKEKPPEPKPEPPKVAEAPKPVVPVAAPKVEPVGAPPPAAANAPMAAPAPATLPAFEFSDGAKEVLTGNSPGGVYKGMVEHAFLTRWNRPEDIDDSAFAAEVKLTVDSSGVVTSCRWISGSGNARWDNSVKEVLTQTKRLSKPPPKGFPSTFNVRFDVQSLKTESLQLGLQ